MEKLSHEQVQQVLGSVPGTLRKLAEERDYWRKEAESRMVRDEAEKVAHEMHSKGLQLDTPIDDLVNSLEKAASAGKLSEIARAVDLVGPDMGQKIAQLTHDDSRHQGGSTALEQFILGDVG